MSSRMDKYKDNTSVPTRSSKNQDLYKQVYNAYDEFENLIIPPNSKEIDLTNLKTEVTSRDEFREVKEYSDITNNKIVRKEMVQDNIKKENEVYDINELLNKAVSSNSNTTVSSTVSNNTDYLKKLKLDNHKTNIEQVKEIYEDIKEESDEEDESLLKTANLSLEILSDLKGDNDITMVSAPIKEDELPNKNETDFYSNTYKFSKKDFDDKKYKSNITSSEDDDIDNNKNDAKGGKFFLKIFLLILGIAIVVLGAIYLINYFNRV